MGERTRETLVFFLNINIPFWLLLTGFIHSYVSNFAFDAELFGVNVWLLLLLFWFCVEKLAGDVNCCWWFNNFGETLLLFVLFDDELLDEDGDVENDDDEEDDRDEIMFWLFRP